MIHYPVLLALNIQFLLKNFLSNSKNGIVILLILIQPQLLQKIKLSKAMNDLLLWFDEVATVCFGRVAVAFQ